MAVAAASAACVVFALLGLYVYRAVAASTAVQFDELLQQQAALALRYADHEYGEGETVVPPAPHTAAGMPFDLIYQIGTRSGEVLYRSQGAPQTPLTSGEGPGCTSLLLQGRSWRACSLSSASTPLVIHLAEPLD
ncbi:MAG: sensor histidine kinase N-terminal domain-containing protein, partial [Gammaproteobacteria bacterium]|nr:sensor histidine kinase N-terminal domain-containing protein [Gammaproteobacteria bacterium]